MITFIIFSTLLLAAVLSYALRNEQAVRFVSLVLVTVVSVLLFFIAYQTFTGSYALDVTGLWYVDHAGSLMLVLLGTLSVFAVAVSYRYIGIEYQRGILSLADVRLYYLLLPLFILSMITAVMANSLVVLWIAMEGTTLATAFLVAIYRRKSSLEAAWKYVLLCSMGIGLALTGLVLTMFAFEAVGLTQNATFLWTNLAAAATHENVNLALLKLAFVFVMVGFSTKIGLVPLHAWLPDALSKTPAPISALLSSALLPVSFFTLLRVKNIVDNALGGSAWTEKFFLVFGLLSILLPAIMIGAQRNYKRVLAYAAIANMGIMMFAVGLGPAGMVPAFMHLPGYALLTSAAFFLAGEIILQARSTDIETVQGLRRRMPITSSLFLIVLLFTLAVPPSAFFVSTLLLAGYGLEQHLFLTLAAVFGVAGITISIMRVAFSLFYKPDDIAVNAQEKRWSLTHTVTVFELFLVLTLGILYLLPQAITFFLEMVRPLSMSL